MISRYKLKWLKTAKSCKRAHSFSVELATHLHWRDSFDLKNVLRRIPNILQFLLLCYCMLVINYLQTYIAQNNMGVPSFLPPDKCGSNKHLFLVWPKNPWEIYVVPLTYHIQMYNKFTYLVKLVKNNNNMKVAKNCKKLFILTGIGSTRNPCVCVTLQGLI